MKSPARLARRPILAAVLGLSFLLALCLPAPVASPLAAGVASHVASPLVGDVDARQQERRGQAPTLHEPSFAPGVVLVKPRAGPQQLLSSLDFPYPVTATEEVSALGIVTLGVPSGLEVEAASLLRRSPLVEWAEPDYLRDAMAVPNDQLYKQFQWNLRKISMEQAWDVTTGDPNLIVAVLDTGVDSSHPDLAGRLIAGYDFLNDDPDPADDGGHGTHNAGIIGAASNNGAGIAGIAWQARVMPLKVLNSGGVGPDSVIAKGIIYAVDHGARVINMSFGSSTTSQTLGAAVRYAYDKGAVLVAAAGNTAKLDNAVIYPAAFDQVLAVGATDESDKVADFSQHHPYVGVSAPGVRIVSTFWRGGGYGSYVSASGTSSAAPHVSGLAALILAANPALTNQQVRDIIQRTSDDLGPAGADEYYGSGRINPVRALAAARPGAAIPAQPSPVAPTSPSPAATPAALPRSVWYFAEGSTAAPFDLWLLLQNPNTAPATARVTYSRAAGAAQVQTVLLPPVSRRSIHVNPIVPDADVSMKVESDSVLFAERAMYFGHDGHNSVGVPAPSNNWYIADGSTRAGFDTWILLQNPLGTPANVTLTFLTSQGGRAESSVVVPAGSRRSVYVNQIVSNSDLSAVVSSDQPIVAERTIYFGDGGGTGGAVSSQLSRNWYLAEGLTRHGYDSWLVAMNPNPAPANLKVTFMPEDGPNVVAYYSIPASSRLAVHLNEVVPASAFGARVESDQPVAVERSTYFGDGSGGHSSAASPLLAQEWYLPEGSSRPPFQEVLAVLNPSERAANLVVTFMKAGGGTDIRYFTVGAASRLTLEVNDLLPDAEVSTKLASDVPVAVERSMYFAGALGGTSSFGIPR